MASYDIKKLLDEIFNLSETTTPSTHQRDENSDPESNNDKGVSEQVNS